MLPKLIAFNLPQFHPIPENDEWWGKGFTEWTNVAKARPVFDGHYQPHLPADLGFYDLRLPEAREAQAVLAREYGIHGFCYYHYWFNGRRILERPVNEVLASGRPDFPFCLCWANENWTRRWDGSEHEVLLEQHYNADDDRKHFRWLAEAFRDPRYIRVHGRPLFLIYRVSLLPDIAGTISRWREEAQQLGIPQPYLVNVEHFGADRALAPSIGFDAGVEFAPDLTCLPYPMGHGRWERKLREWGIRKPRFNGYNVFSYKELVDIVLAKPKADYLRFPCVAPSWDNSARRKAGALMLHDATPAVYQKWLEEVIRRFQPPSSDEHLVFINAWNEWAEGCHLEPDQRWGRAWLEATRDALASQAGLVGEL